MIRAIAFDFDGVLVESVAVKTHAYALLFSDEKEQVVSQFIEYHNKHGGVSRFEKIRLFYKDMLHRALSEEHFQGLCSRFSQLVVDEVIAAPWVEGAKEFLAQNKYRYTFAIVSGTPEGELKEIVRRRGMGHFFDAVRGSPEDKVTLLAQVIAKYNLMPEEIVFIGDTVTDYLAAQELGIHFLWRCVSDQIPLISGYSGPRLSSLNEIDLAIKRL